MKDFYSRPCGRGDLPQMDAAGEIGIISTHAPAGGATKSRIGDVRREFISTHAPAGGATSLRGSCAAASQFLLTPLREGRLWWLRSPAANNSTFLLTPLREGRQVVSYKTESYSLISTHAPAGGATENPWGNVYDWIISTHAPAGGATRPIRAITACPVYFYSRPCGRGDGNRCLAGNAPVRISTHAPAGGATGGHGNDSVCKLISTHAPAGGATFVKYALDSYGQFLLTPLREGRQGDWTLSKAIWKISTHAPAGGATRSCRR